MTTVYRVILEILKIKDLKLTNSDCKKQANKIWGTVQLTIRHKIILSHQYNPLSYKSLLWLTIDS